MHRLLLAAMVIALPACATIRGAPISSIPASLAALAIRLADIGPD